MNGEHELSDFLCNENIKADRFGYAAISYIFKAFGDDKRSKEFWPWGSTVNFSWNNGNDNIDGDLMKQINEKSWNVAGNISNLTRALLCLAAAHERLEKDNEDTEVQDTDASIKGLRRRLSVAKTKIKSSDTISDKINEVSNDTLNKLNDLENYE